MKKKKIKSKKRKQQSATSDGLDLFSEAVIGVLDTVQEGVDLVTGSESEDEMSKIKRKLDRIERKMNSLN